MNIDISNLINEKKQELLIEKTIPQNEIISNLEEFSYNGDVFVKGSISLNDEFYTLKLAVKCNILVACTRCLSLFEKEIDLSITRKYSYADLDDYEFYKLEGTIINIFDVIEEEILLTLGINEICSENCKGICQKCGTVLNEKNCDCDIEPTRIEFLKLKELLD